MRRILRAVHALAFAGLTVAAAPALTVTPLDDKLVAVEIASSGQTRDEALREARVQAVLGTAGRVFLDNQLIRADHLLERYLRNYAANFVNTVEVVEERFTGGQNVLRSRVFVNYEALVADLHEKRFLYNPAFKPMFTVFMQESLDGGAMPQEVSRPLLQNALETVGMRSYRGIIASPPTSIDIKADADLLREAIAAAERRNVELLVSGSTVTTQRAESDFYYDTFFFYDTEMQASLIRVDTGEILRSVTVRGSASHRDRAEAIRLSIERAASEAAVELDETYTQVWTTVVLPGANFEVLLTGASDELIRIISLHLTGLGNDAEVAVRRKFDRTAILTIRTRASRDAVMELLRGCPFPVLTIIREIGQRQFEVQVSG